MNKRKKYNNQTGCFKIDLFINGSYVCSTDQSKTCKEAKALYASKYHLEPTDKLTAKFYYH